jgi:hypothetical protein
VKIGGVELAKDGMEKFTDDEDCIFVIILPTRALLVAVIPFISKSSIFDVQ